MRVNKEILYFDLGYEWFKYEKHTAARMEQEKILLFRGNKEEKNQFFLIHFCSFLKAVNFLS